MSIRIAACSNVNRFKMFNWIDTNNHPNKYKSTFFKYL